MTATGDMEPAAGDGLEEKNVIRRKFGLPNLSASEYAAVEIKNLEIAREQAKQQQQRLQQQRELREARTLAEPVGRGNFFTKLMEKVLPSSTTTCETVDDCESPQECCDLIAVKICCSSGLTSSSWTPDYIPEPIPAVVQDPDGRTNGPQSPRTGPYGRSFY
jgi:hypothetical protein